MYDENELLTGDPSLFDSGLSLNFVHKRLIGAVKGFVIGGPTGAGVGFLTSGGGGTVPPPMVGRFAGSAGRVLRTDCPEGARAFPDGHCHNVVGFATQETIAAHPELARVKLPGAGAAVARFLPFGETGFGVSPSDFGEAVIGAFGMPALVPAVVGQIANRVGVISNILRCPRGAVLGKDDLCYNKIPNSFRKWPRAPRAPVTAADAKCIRRAASAKGRVERLAKSVGLKTSKRR